MQAEPRRAVIWRVFVEMLVDDTGDRFGNAVYRHQVVDAARETALGGSEMG